MQQNCSLNLNGTLYSQKFNLSTLTKNSKTVAKIVNEQTALKSKYAKL